MKPVLKLKSVEESRVIVIAVDLGELAIKLTRELVQPTLRVMALETNVLPPSVVTST
jgi:hypothetical protein